MIQLMIDRKQLRESIQSFLLESGAFRRLKRGEPAGSVAISFRHPYVAISNGNFGHRYEAEAAGSWPGEAVFDAGFLAKSWNSVPGDQHTILRMDSGRFYLDEWVGIPCWWRASRAYFEAPHPEAELIKIVYMRLTASDPELDAKSLLPAVRVAEQRQWSAIEEAIKILAPFGIGCWDLYRATESAARWHGCHLTDTSE